MAEVTEQLTAANSELDALRITCTSQDVRVTDLHTKLEHHTVQQNESAQALLEKTKDLFEATKKIASLDDTLATERQMHAASIEAHKKQTDELILQLTAVTAENKKQKGMLAELMDIAEKTSTAKSALEVKITELEKELQAKSVRVVPTHVENFA